MKIDEPASVDSEPAPTPTPNKRAATSETLSNLSRVTPAQLQHISFPAEGRFQPVRPVGRGGGGIVMLVDSKEGEEVSWIEPFGAPAAAPAAPAAAEGETTPVAQTGAQTADDEAAPPPSVQVSG
jgi:26S proteasome regulatory subunit N2